MIGRRTGYIKALPFGAQLLAWAIYKIFFIREVIMRLQKTNLLTGTALSLLLGAVSVYPAMAQQNGGATGGTSDSSQMNSSQTMTGIVRGVYGNVVRIEMPNGKTTDITLTRNDMERLNLRPGMRVVATMMKDGTTSVALASATQESATSTGTTGMDMTGQQGMTGQNQGTSVTGGTSTSGSMTSGSSTSSQGMTSRTGGTSQLEESNTSTTTTGTLGDNTSTDNTGTAADNTSTTTNRVTRNNRSTTTTRAAQNRPAVRALW